MIDMSSYGLVKHPKFNRYVDNRGLVTKFTFEEADNFVKKNPQYSYKDVFGIFICEDRIDENDKIKVDRDWKFFRDNFPEEFKQCFYKSGGHFEKNDTHYTLDTEISKIIEDRNAEFKREMKLYTGYLSVKNGISSRSRSRSQYKY